MKYIFFFIILSTLFTITIFARLGYTWAGGKSMPSSLNCRILQIEGDPEIISYNNTKELKNEHNLTRGESIATQDNEYIAFSIGEGVIVALDEKTTLRIERIDNEQVSLFLKCGRIYVDNKTGLDILKVVTNFTENIINETASIVNFDFLESVLIIPIKGDVKATSLLNNKNISTTTPISIHETNPFKIEPRESYLELKTTSLFYEWIDRNSKLW